MKALEIIKPRSGSISKEPEKKKIFVNEALLPERKKCYTCRNKKQETGLGYGRIHEQYLP